MNIKKLIFLSIAIESVFLFSCKKDQGTDNTSAPPQLTEQLTQDTLKFELYTLNWNETSERTYYKRGGSNNYINLDTSWFKFDKNGTYIANMPGYNYTARWEFLESGRKLRLFNKVINLDQKITVIKISKDTVEWLDTVTDNLFSRLIDK